MQSVEKGSRWGVGKWMRPVERGSRLDEIR